MHWLSCVVKGQGGETRKPMYLLLSVVLLLVLEQFSMVSFLELDQIDGASVHVFFTLFMRSPGAVKQGNDHRPLHPPLPTR